MGIEPDWWEVRAASLADLPALTALRSPVAVHRDRLRDATGPSLLYLVVVGPSEVIGFGMLVFDWPATWPDPEHTPLLPLMIDLFVRPDSRSRGAGTFLVRWMETAARDRGATYLYVSVDPVENPRAHQLYLRLGYTPLQPTPYRSSWAFTDSDGQRHSGEDWQIDLRRPLGDA